MLLACDIGNTHTTLGLWAGGAWRGELRWRTEAGRTVDETVALLDSLLARKLVALSQWAPLSGAVIGSVVPAATAALVRALEAELALRTLVAGPHLDEGVIRRTSPPEATGIDRVVNALAAHCLHRTGPEHGFVIVDLGTATKVDLVSPTGEFLGGAIAAGVETSARALLGATAQLPRFELQLPERALGASTAGALQSGVVLGHVALVDGLVGRLRTEARFDVRVVATGGWAGLLAAASDTIQVVVTSLTLDGLRLLWERNPPPT